MAAVIEVKWSPYNSEKTVKVIDIESLIFWLQSERRNSFKKFNETKHQRKTVSNFILPFVEITIDDSMVRCCCLSIQRSLKHLKLLKEREIKLLWGADQVWRLPS